MDNYTGHVRKRITKTGAVRYQVIIESPRDNATGKRKRKHYTLKGTKKEAEKFLRDTLTELENKTFVEPSDILLKDWIVEWYKTFVKDKLSESTLRSYKYQIEKYIIPLLGDIPIQNLSTMQIQKMLNDFEKESPVSHKPMSPKSIKNIFLNLSAALEKAVDLELLKKNPCKKVELPRCEQHEVNIYDEDEIDVLIACAKDTDMELIVMLSLSLGLRRGELIALRWEHVDLDNGVIHIRENRVDGLNGNVVTKKPKSRAGIRDIPISGSLIKMLAKYKEEYKLIQAKYNVGFNNDDYIICKANGAPYKPASFTKRFRTFLEKNGLRHIRFHDVRHTQASIMLANGISPKVAQQRLGHSDFSTTMNIYTHLTKKVEMEAAQQIDEALFGKVSDQ